MIRGAHVATKSIAFLIEKGQLEENFNEAASRLLKQTPGIYGLQLVQDAVIVHTFPLEENEMVLGYDLSAKKPHVLSLEIAEDREDIYFEGPFLLKQGFLGIVGRYPIILADSLWGFSAVVIKCEELRDFLGLSISGENDGFIYQIVNSAELGNDTPLFEHVEPVDGEQGELISGSIDDWNFWVYKEVDKTWFFIGIAVIAILSLLIGLLAWHLVRLPQLLQEKIRKRTIALVSATEQLRENSGRLEKQDEEIERLSFVASHHLQEPMRLIEIYVSRYVREMAKKKEALTTEELLLIKEITEQSKKLKLIISDLSQLLSVPSLHADSETQGLKLIIQKILNHRLPKLDSGNVHANIEDIDVPRVLFELIVHHMIDNAIKFKHPNRELILTIEGRINDHNYSLSFKDNGVGIQEAYIPLIFDVFSKLNHDCPGNGIGLAIVSKCVQQINGTVHCSSSLESGTSFMIHFPLPLRTGQ